MTEWAFTVGNNDQVDKKAYRTELQRVPQGHSRGKEGQISMYHLIKSKKEADETEEQAEHIKIQSNDMFGPPKKNGKTHTKWFHQIIKLWNKVKTKKESNKEGGKYTQLLKSRSNALWWWNRIGQRICKAAPDVEAGRKLSLNLWRGPCNEVTARDGREESGVHIYRIEI